LEKFHCPNNKKATNHYIIKPKFQKHHKLVQVLDVLSMRPQTINMSTILRKLNFNLRPWNSQKLMIKSATLRKKTCMVFPPLWKCLFRRKICWCQFLNSQIVGTTRFGKNVIWNCSPTKLWRYKDNSIFAR
jgi:hypothetical protein